ncbi:hypothetical protein Taro_043769, partial [Colocasia esculenta]|nr:hypothetical protein [Colocasia esculenta]
MTFHLLKKVDSTTNFVKYYQQRRGEYDTIIWILISLLLVLAWGVGIIMLLYLPIRRYILQKDISSRKLYVTPGEIVYKVIRPSFLPFLGFAKFEKRIPLHLVIDIIIEQGCLQSHYGIHTFRVENIAYGKASPVDELQVQGVSDPELLRKVIISEAAKVIQEAGGWKPRTCMEEGESTPTRSRSLADVSPIARFHSPSGKKIESLVEGSQAGSDEQAPLVDSSVAGTGFLIVPTFTYLVMNLNSQSCKASSSNGPRPETSPVKSFSSKDILARALLASLPAKTAYGPPGP